MDANLTRLKMDKEFLEKLEKDKNEAIKMGGNLQIVRREVEILSPVSVIPELFVIDISKIKFGGIVRMSSVDLKEGQSPVITDRDFVLASMKAPRGASEEGEDDD